MPHPGDLTQTKWLMTILLCLTASLLSACGSGGTNPTSTPTLSAAVTPVNGDPAPTSAPTSAPSATRPPTATATPSPTPTETGTPTPKPSIILEKYTECITRKGFDSAEQMRALYLEALRSAQTMPSTLRDLVRKCATFTLDFDSTMVGNSTSISAAQFTSRLTAQVMITVDDKGLYAGAGPIHYDHFDIDPPNPNPRECQPYTFSPADSTLQVTGLDLGIAVAPRTSPAPPSLMTLLMQPGSPLENVSLTCKGITAHFYTTPTGFWEAAFRIFHADERVGNEAAIIGWTLSGDAATVATREYHRTLASSKVRLKEDTVITLTHTPQP